MSADSLHELRQLLVQYPGNGLLSLLYLENLLILRDPFFESELSRLYMQLPDPGLLFAFSRGMLSGEIASGQPSKEMRQTEDESSMPQETGDSTISLIDSFLETKAGESESELRLEYQSDYALTMEPQADGLMDDQDIDRIMEGLRKTLSSRPAPGGDLQAAIHDEPPVGMDPETEPASEPEPLDESCFTETLAHIYIRQKRYDKALEILERISLINPKKNAYFADQIRFLRKLINNTKKK